MNRKSLTELEDMLDNLDPEGEIVQDHFQEEGSIVGKDVGLGGPLRTLHVNLVNGNLVVIFETIAYLVT